MRCPVAKKPRTKITEGCRARLNAAFYAMFREEPRDKPRMLTVLCQYDSIPGAWRVSLDDVSVPQIVHEKFLEVT